MTEAYTPAPEASPEPHTTSSSTSSVPSIPLSCLQHPGMLDLCSLRQWRSTLSATAQEFNTNFPAFKSHLQYLQTLQTLMHRLARKCTQARLYPNPASSNSKLTLKPRLTTLIADMNVAAQLHNVYSAALMFYTFPVQAIVNDIEVTNVCCDCAECTARSERQILSTHMQIVTEAAGLLASIAKASTAFEETEEDVLRKWEEGGCEALSKLVDSLPEQKDLKEMAVVKKYFPQQIKMMREVDEEGSKSET